MSTAKINSGNVGSPVWRKEAGRYQKGAATFVNDAYSALRLSGLPVNRALPRADQLPFSQLKRQEAVCLGIPLRAKGKGKNGAIDAPATVTNAVDDALPHFEAAHIDMPLTPNRVPPSSYAANTVLSTAPQMPKATLDRTTQLATAG